MLVVTVLTNPCGLVTPGEIRPVLPAQRMKSPGKTFFFNSKKQGVPGFPAKFYHGGSKQLTCRNGSFVRKDHPLHRS